MIPGNAQLLKCPHCGEIKPVLSLVSGNTIGGRQWSDTKGEYPMLPRVSMVQNCPHCGRYFLTSLCQDGYADDDYSDETGTLNYEQAKEAWHQFSEQKIKPSHKGMLLMELIYAWNDNFVRSGNRTQPTNEDREIFKTWAYELIATRGTTDLLSCELLRECGMFEECLNALEAIRASIDSEIMFVVDQIEAHAKAGNWKTFILQPAE